MLVPRIVQPSPALESFLDSLHLPLSQPQRDHLLHLVDGSLVCEERKTLAALQRQFLDFTDPSNWADFLRISPWFAEDVRCDSPPPGRMARGRSPTAESPQGSLCEPRRLTRQKRQTNSGIKPVDWFHDHNESTPRHPRYYKAFCYLECTLHAEDLQRHGRIAFISATRPCGDSTAIVPPSSGCTFAATPAKTAAAGGLGDLRPVRQLVRFGAAAQIHPSSRLARSLWPEEQPEVLGATPRSIRHHLTAQAVHARARDRCGREHDDVSRAGRRGTVVESSL